jgi:phosphopantetheine adenylyltransferase
MAEKSKKKEDELKKVVAKTDQLTVDSQSKVVNSDLENLNIENLIHVIRGQKVMLDFDSAMLYGTETKALNQAVKRNVERFPDDFMFQLTKGELESLRSQIVTTNVSRNQNVEEWRSQFVTSNFAKMGLRRPPYAFTRNGIGMLSSVLRSATAVGVNIRIMRAFTAIPEIVNNNVLMMQRILNIEHLLGASVKDMGVGMCAVTKMEVSPETILGLLK